MALSDEQEFALFDILEIPESTKVYRIVDQDNLTVIDREATNVEQQARANIISHLATLAAGKETRLKVYLDRWLVIDTDPTVIEGSVGNLTGITDNPEHERTQIRRKVLILVPFYRFHDQLSRQSSSGLSVNIMR